MAKGTRGGKRITATMLAGAPTVTPTQVTPPTPQQVAQGNVLPAGGVPFSQFEQMTDDEKADVVTDALGAATPLFLDDSGIQRFAYFTGMSDKPTKVTDAQLDGMKGTEIYRTVNDAYNPTIDVGYTSRDIAKQISDGDYTMFSDSGGSAHGKAIYFASSYNDSSYYGNSRQNPVTMRAKITGGKSIQESSLDSMYRNAIARGDKLALACSNAGGGSARNLYGLAKGYDVITPNRGSNYYMVLNRRCLTVSDTIKKTNIGGMSW